MSDAARVVPCLGGGPLRLPYTTGERWSTAKRTRCYSVLRGILICSRLTMCGRCVLAQNKASREMSYFFSVIRICYYIRRFQLFDPTRASFYAGR